MLRKCMEELQAKGYAMTCHYDPTLHELYICVTDGTNAKHEGLILSSEWLSNDEGMAMQINKLVERLEASRNG